MRAELVDALAAEMFAAFTQQRFVCRCSVPMEELSLEDAYDVQRRVVELRSTAGEQPVGYKVGCTSSAIRAQFGLTEPISGVLMAPRVHRGDQALDLDDFVDCAVEPEFVLTLGADIRPNGVDDESLIAAIASVSPGVEIHNYRFWHGRPTSQELVASNGIHAALVIGDAEHPVESVDLRMEGVGLFVDGFVVESGIGAEIMGGPLDSLRWLVRHLDRRGERLQSGDLVIPGSAVGLVSIKEGDHVEARFTHFETARVAFTRSSSQTAITQP